jgi:predicted metalloendopeptidase
MFYTLGVGALFGFDIEGDVGLDPKNMVLWFSQPSLGLPSKVGLPMNHEIVQDLTSS